MSNTLKFKPKITCFYCINAFGDEKEMIAQNERADLQFVKMACSSMVKDIFILKAFETGADGVLVLVCPEDGCRYIKGSRRAKKRVDWLKNLLDVIGVGGDRLVLHHPSSKDLGLDEKVKNLVDSVIALGPNPGA